MKFIKQTIGTKAQLKAELNLDIKSDSNELSDNIKTALKKLYLNISDQDEVTKEWNTLRSEVIKRLLEDYL